MHSRLKGVARKTLFRCHGYPLPSNTIFPPFNFALRPRMSISVALVDRSVLEFSQRTQQRYTSVGRSSYSVSATNKPLTPVSGSGKQSCLLRRSYQDKAKRLLDQVKRNQVQSELVIQKVEELLLLSLSECDNNIPSDGPLALKLLNTALRYATNSSDEKSLGERLIPRLFSLSCQLMLRSGHIHSIDEVHHLLWKLLDGHKEFLVDDSTYNTHHVNDACSYYIRHDVMDANKNNRTLDGRRSRRLHLLIKRLAELQRDPSVPLVANPYIEDSLILLLCNQVKLREAHEVLRRRVEKSLSAPPQHREREVPLVSSFITIINGYAKTSQPDKARRIVEWMMSFHEKKDHSSPLKTKTTDITAVPPPDVNCFNALLHAYAIGGAKNAGFKAEKTLEWMANIHETMSLDTRPNDISYNISINSWARSNHPDAPIRAENLLRHLAALGESGREIEPSEGAFTAVMNTWVNSSGNSRYNKKAKEATNRVAGILNLMEHFAENSRKLSLSAIPYTVLIKAWEKTAQNSHGIEKQKCGDEILEVLERMSTKGIAHTAEVYNSVLTALIQVSPISAVIYFLELEQQYCNGVVQLDSRTFNCGLNAIAMLNRPDAVKTVTGILKRMYEYHETDPSILPSKLTFNIILKVLSRSTSHIPGAAAKAEDLLSEMDDMSSVTPDFISYLHCIMAWGRSHDKDKIERAINLMHRFISSMGDHQDGNNKSSVAVFNAVLSVCHHNLSPQHSVEALHATKLTMIELRKLKGIAPDQKTYETFFQVFKEVAHMEICFESSVTALIGDEFNQCASDGYVTKDVVSALFLVTPRTVLEKIVGQNMDSRNYSIPKAWCRNVIT